MSKKLSKKLPPHYLQTLISDVDKTHPHLGPLMAMAMVAIKGKKLLVVVSPSGCGKSRVSSYIGLSCPGSSLQDRLSIAGLAHLQAELTNFQSVLIVDDIAKTQTPYARLSTITTLAELVYSHYCVSNLSRSHYDIRDFHGSAIVNVQPVLLRELVASPEWEASIQDKSLRYYHLHRPIKPEPMPPKMVIAWGEELTKVEKPNTEKLDIQNLLNIGAVQWSRSRCFEHVVDLLKACAALDNRDKVNKTDVEALTAILQPMRVEQLVMIKKHFESERKLASDELAILTEFISHGNFTLHQLSLDYKLAPAHCYNIMSKYARDWEIVNKNPTTYAPSDELKAKLHELRLI